MPWPICKRTVCFSKFWAPIRAEDESRRTSSRIYSYVDSVRAGQADRGSGARVRHLELDQARGQRESLGAFTEGLDGDPRKIGSAAPLSGRRLFLSEAGHGAENWRRAGKPDLWQRLQ